MLLLKDLKQIDNHQFCIRWMDDQLSFFHLFELQKHCPCNRCKKEEPKVDEKVKALRIQNVGCYALRVDFTTGCSNGIYTFSLLRRLSLGDA